MGTIRERSGRFTAQIRIMRDKRLVYQQAQTFDRRTVAAAWIKKREGELAQPGALERLHAQDPTLADVIDRYIEELGREAGRTKAQCLRTIKTDCDIGRLKCSEVNSVAISSLARQLAGRGIEPATIGNYLSHLSAVVKVARPLWGYPLAPQSMTDASTALRATKVIGKSRRRDRRPTLEELDKLMTHFGRVRHKRKDSIPMQAIVAFAIFSTRRMEEILRIAWVDLDEAGSRILVRDMKDPKEKTGNNMWCELPPEALQIVQAQPRIAERIFPASVDAAGAAFTRACQLLGMSDPGWPDERNLHFHDLRHDGISRLFEMGRNIPQVACVSGHRSWTSLKRYTHMRQTGDKYAGWAWLAAVSSGNRQRCEPDASSISSGLSIPCNAHKTTNN
jgi:integrase